MKINTDELDNFVKATVESIARIQVDLRKEKEDTEDYYALKSSIDFEISVAIQKTGKGKINIIIADIGGDYKKEVLSKITFQIDNFRNITMDRKMRNAELSDLTSIFKYLKH